MSRPRILLALEVEVPEGARAIDMLGAVYGAATRGVEAMGLHPIAEASIDVPPGVALTWLRRTMEPASAWGAASDGR
jgi:hypothetical protein